MQEQKAESTILQANIPPEEQCLTTTQAIKENVSNLETFLKKHLNGNNGNQISNNVT